MRQPGELDEFRVKSRNYHFDKTEDYRLERALSITLAFLLAGIGLGFSMLAHRQINIDRPSPWRSVAGIVGGFSFLVQVLWLDAWTAVTISGILTVFVTIIWMLRKKKTIYARPEQSRAEVTYAIAGTISLVISWAILGNRWLAFIPISFMAWGDNVAGLSRTTLFRDHPASFYPSLCMLGVCTISSYLMQPWWIGGIGGLVATIIERYRPRYIRSCDDNPIELGLSLLVMALLLKITT
jgi:hypothetical protein